jgi:hypothetical protein
MSTRRTASADLADLEAQISRYTVVTSTDPSQPPRRVLVLLPGVDLTAGFAVARKMLAAGPLRVIGHGVTTRARQPSWASGARGLWLTELGAYKFRGGVLATVPLRDGLRAWVDDVVGRIGGIDASRVLWQSACLRFFQNNFDAHLFNEGIAIAHAADEVVLHGQTWSGAPQLEPRRSGKRRALDRIVWPLAISGATGAALVGTTAIVARDYLRAAPARGWLRASLRRPPAREPRLWVAVLPGYARINLHFLESVVRPALARRQDVGVLLVGNITPGTRRLGDLRRSDQSGALWGGLGFLETKLQQMDVAQCAAAETLSQLAGDLAQATLSTVRATARLALRGPYVTCDSLEYSLLRDVKNVARFLSLDIARATAAERATARFLRYRDLRGATVVLPASSAAGIAPVDASLQDAGASTIELFHGTGGDYWFGAAESASATRCVWSDVDAKLHDGALHDVIVGGMPVPAPRTRRVRTDGSWNVLVMTNLVHRDCELGGFSMRPFQQDLLRSVQRLLDQEPRLCFRWRPHPADVERLVEEDLPRLPALELSRGRPLTEDFDWADIVVSTQSTSLVEALVTGLPVIGYVYPEAIMATTYLHPSRSFFRGDDLGDRLHCCIDDITSATPESRFPEEYALERLFGPSRTPRRFPFASVMPKLTTPSAVEGAGATPKS